MKQPRASGIGVRRALAGQIGQEKQPFAAGRTLGRFARRARHRRFCLCRAASLQTCSANHCSEPPALRLTPIMCHLPCTAWQNVCSRPSGSTCTSSRVDEHHAAGADRRRKRAARDDAGAHGIGRAVAGAADHHAIGRKPKLLGDRRRQFAGDLLRLIACGQQRLIELQLFQQLFRPVALGHIEQQHAAGVAHFGGKFARQPAANFILGQQHLGQLVEVLRLVVSQPQDLRGGEAGQRRVGDQLDQLLAPAGPPLDFLALGLRPLIVPEQRPANDLAALVEKHRAVHLPRQADRLHVGRPSAWPFSRRA